MTATKFVIFAIVAYVIIPLSIIILYDHKIIFPKIASFIFWKFIPGKIYKIIIPNSEGGRPEIDILNEWLLWFNSNLGNRYVYWDFVTKSELSHNGIVVAIYIKVITNKNKNNMVYFMLSR